MSVRTSGSSMNPARTFAPDPVSGKFTVYRIYMAGPLAVGLAFVLPGAGGGNAGAGAARRSLFTTAQESNQP